MNILKKMQKKTLLILAIAILIIVNVGVIYVHNRAEIIGGTIGETSGEIVGAAVGSFRGVTEGISSGMAAGEAEGLSATDTTVDIKGRIESVGKLEVLVAGVSLKNYNELGNSYSGLHIIKGDAVFAVDLNKVEINVEKTGNQVNILIPLPELEVYLNQESTETLAEKQNFSLSVNAKDGLTEYLNSMKNIDEKAEESIANYDSLIAIAKEFAIDQVTQLASAICGGDSVIQVEFK